MPKRYYFNTVRLRQNTVVKVILDCRQKDSLHSGQSNMIDSTSNARLSGDQREGSLHFLPHGIGCGGSVDPPPFVGLANVRCGLSCDNDRK